MARSESFGSGLGLDLHVRTAMVNDWSLISNAALRIGNDVFELANDGTYYLNGVPNSKLPLTMEGNYSVATKVVDLQGIPETHYSVSLRKGEDIFISLFKGMISVRVEAVLDNTEGMLGTQDMPGMIGRDHGTVLTDPNEMGAQWQVTDTEPMLFHEARAPQYPTCCTLPKTDVKSRRLKGFSSERMKLIEDWCSKVDADLRQFCIDDIILTGDFDLANHYAYSF